MNELVTETVIYLHSGLDLHRNVFTHVRLVTPLPDSLQL
jgi:hypothetical protein